MIDNIGLLNTLYRYGTAAYIGGGFGKDIHNTLEPAAFGLPILFGPKYEKFEEARQFVARGGDIRTQRSGTGSQFRQATRPCFLSKCFQSSAFLFGRKPGRYPGR